MLPKATSIFSSVKGRSKETQYVIQRLKAPSRSRILLVKTEAINSNTPRGTSWDCLS